MTSRDFCYWLQGALELSPGMALTPDQMLVVRNHLSLVFKHEIDSPDPTGELQAIHDGVEHPPVKPIKPASGPSFHPNPLIRC